MATEYEGHSRVTGTGTADSLHTNESNVPVPVTRDVYFDVPRTDPDNPETRQVTFLTPAEISAKLTTWGNLKKPISIRKLNVLMEKKGYVRFRNGRKGSRGYMVVELDSATVQSNRIISTGPAVF